MIKTIPLLNDVGAELAYQVTISPGRLGWVLLRHGEEIRVLNRFESNFVESAIAAATTHKAKEVDAELSQVLTERDSAEERLDRLLDKLAAHFGTDFGEHTSAHDPLQVALDTLDEKQSKLRVWFGPMPESNGKVNWTAILHTGDLSEGWTLDRSEYTDRIRYAADQVRFLLGELPTAPWVLDYDPNLKAPADYEVKK